MASISMSQTSLAPPKLHHQHQLEDSFTNTLVTHRRSSSVRPITLPAIAPRQKYSTFKSNTSHLATNWRQIHGANDWHNLITPLNPLLRDELIRYGEFVTACYIAFDLNPTSDHFLNCKYEKSQILCSSGFLNSGYNITKYIYATADINIPTLPRTSSWVGFVAVSNDSQSRRLGRRDVLVSFRGTVTTTEWIANLMSSLTPARLDPRDQRTNLRVESGFLNLYTSEDNTHGSCRQQLLKELRRVIDHYKGEDMSITLAGHSMGSSLALLLGYDLAEQGLNRDGTGRTIPVTVYSFGGPRVGNVGFKERCDELGVKVLRVVNVSDPVTKMPGVLMNEGFRFLMRHEMPWSCSCYAHVGVELSFDGPFKMDNLRHVHDLETYLELLKSAKKVRIGKSSVPLDAVRKVREWVGKKFEVWPWMDAGKLMGNFLSSIDF